MATIFRKTDKGQSEIETRLYRLAPRLRTALILVDGRRSDVELAKLIPGDPESSLRMLLGDGFIEIDSAHEGRSAHRHAPASSGSRSGAPSGFGSGFGLPTGSGFGGSTGSGFGSLGGGADEPGGRTRPPTGPGFVQHRRNAIKSLTDQVGPMAEAVALRMEKCGDWNQLLPVLQLAQQVIRNTRGASAAQEFGADHIDSPPD